MNTLRLTTNNEHPSSSESSVDVHFDGSMEATVRCEVVKEMMKYVLYETGQIPMVFNQIKELNNREQMQIENGNVASKKPGDQSRIPMKRIIPSPQAVLVESVNALCETIQAVFGSSGLGTIRQVLFLLGNSVSLPRHSVLLNLPSSSADGGEVIKAAAGLRTLFQALMVEDLLYGAQSQGAAISKLFVLFLAPRGTNAQKIGLQPSLTFKLTGLRGKLYTINFLCKYKELVKKKANLDVSSDWDESGHDRNDELDLSGIVPFSPFPKPFQRSSDPHKDEQEAKGIFKVPQNPGPIGIAQLKSDTIKTLSRNGCLEQIHSTPKMISSLVSDTCVQSGTEFIDELSIAKNDDFIWYQALVVIKGYTEKQPKGAL